MFRYRPALEYDLAHIGMNAADAVSRGWNYAAGMAGEIMRDTYSHCHAAVMGWGYVPNPADVLYANWLDAMAQMHHQRGKVQPTPVKRPWEQAERERPVAFLDTERAKRRAALKARLGLNT